MNVIFETEKQFRIEKPAEQESAILIECGDCGGRDWEPQEAARRQKPCWEGSLATCELGSSDNIMQQLSLIIKFFHKHNLYGMARAPGPGGHVSRHVATCDGPRARGEGNAVM